ncbi:hypothetical protein HC823_02320 [Candidatus Gracilibacteria bacterium]|nr:hypothetical protein [Candidatus Gracilibacteria bacterium]
MIAGRWKKCKTTRRALREKGMSYTVIKKNIDRVGCKRGRTLRIFFGGIGRICCGDRFSYRCCYASTGDQNPQKDFFNKEKKFSKFDFAGALFEGKFLNAAEAAVFADTATREESLAKIMGMLRSGPQGLHTVLQSGFRRNINVLQNADKFTK